MTGRPDPDALLAQVQREESRERRGWLKVFLGACPGVGKTFTMLETARARRAAGTDLVVGVVETHGRQETARLVEGLEILPRRRVEYRGVTLEEFDLDAALARHPDVLLVDELAHTNAPGSRHTRRWQDVIELLDAGIDVHTTINIQHLESLNDVVAQITGVTVRETVPDSMLERADEIELVDVSADVVVQRMREGKVYLPDQAASALERFFRPGNLIALRELALRETARRVDTQLRGYRKARGIQGTWRAAERVLVCVGPNPASARLIRAARRMAADLRAEWFAAYVETSAHERMSEAETAAVLENLRLAEELGARAVTLTGQGASEELLAWARANSVTRIVVGKPTHPRWRDRLLGSLHDALIRGSGDIDVYVISGEEAEEGPRRGGGARAPGRFAGVPGAAGTVLVVTAACLVLRPYLSTTDVAMAYLLGVVLASAQFPGGAALTASLLSIAAFDFCFVPPYYTFAVSDTRFGLTFGVMLAIALVMSRLTARIRRQAVASREREQRTAALYAMSRELSAARDVEGIAAIAARHIAAALPGRVAVLLGGEDGHAPLRVAGGDALDLVDDPKEMAVAQWVREHAQAAGVGTDTLPAARARYLPLGAASRALGVVAVEPAEPRRLREPEQLRLLETFVGQTAIALERVLLAGRHEKVRVEVEAERLRASLLSSLSHDLRTPLAGIEGAATGLLASGDATDPLARLELLQTIVGESRRMMRLVTNLLDMMRVESGSLEVHREWQPLEEVVGVALIRLDQRLQGRTVTTDLPADLPLVPIDGLLIEQALINLLENAIKHTPEGTPIEIAAVARRDEVTVEVADRGPGLPAGEEERIFDKFRRLPVAAASGGVGLGLTICRGIVHAHGGRIWAANREGGGSVFRFTIPIVGAPPDVGEAES